MNVAFRPMTAAISPALTEEMSSVVRVHLQKPADSLTFALGGVQRVATGFHLAGIDAHKRQLADMRISRDFEHQG